jgi:hypothetical protein
VSREIYDAMVEEVAAFVEILPPRIAATSTVSTCSAPRAR